MTPRILQSLPGIGVRVVATMFAEAAGLLHNRNHHALRVLGGTAPVTKRSGKHGFVRMLNAWLWGDSAKRSTASA